MEYNILKVFRFTMTDYKYVHYNNVHMVIELIFKRLALLIQTHKIMPKYEAYKLDFITSWKVVNPIMIWTVYFI